MRIFGGGNDRFAAHIERGIDQHRATGFVFEMRQQCVKPRVCIRVHGLNSGGVVDMRYRGYFRARNVQQVDAE